MAIKLGSWSVESGMSCWNRLNNETEGELKHQMQMAGNCGHIKY